MARRPPRHTGDVETGVEELFRSEYEPMFRLAFTMLGSDAAAEDVVQEAFLAVAARWTSVRNPGGYLRVSVVNGVRKRWQADAIRRRTEERAANATSEESVVGDLYLLDAVDALPERQRLAVVLTYYGGLRSGEVGDLIGCKAATVRSLVHRALESLGEVIER
jgi:RNA polymerase sigma factor (sigma-70 family)